jgi:hypothetical protein
MNERRDDHDGLTAVRVVETIFAGCVLGLLITRPRWGLHALGLLSGRSWAPDTPAADDARGRDAHSRGRTKGRGAARPATRPH